MLPNSDQKAGETGAGVGPPGHTRALWRAPVREVAARLGWRVRYSELTLADPPYWTMQVTPVFPGCHAELFERGVVWDVFALIDAARRPGAHQVLTADCGYAPDVYIEASVQVSHPDACTIVWELDLPGLRPALDAALTAGHGSGFVRLVFERAAYEADLRALLHALQARARAPVPADELATVQELEIPNRGGPPLSEIRIGLFEPEVDGPALARLLALNADAAWPREPVWPPGTRLEFGYFDGATGHEWMRVDGVVQKWVWPGRFFPRWEALHAFTTWVATTTQEPSWPPTARPADGDMPRANLRHLRQEADRQPCHEAGRRLAAVLQSCLDEGETAPGVSVHYAECALPVGPP